MLNDYILVSHGTYDYQVAIAKGWRVVDKDNDNVCLMVRWAC